MTTEWISTAERLPPNAVRVDAKIKANTIVPAREVEGVGAGKWFIIDEGNLLNAVSMKCIESWRAQKGDGKQ